MTMFAIYEILNLIVNIHIIVIVNIHLIIIFYFFSASSNIYQKQSAEPIMHVYWKSIWSRI